VATTATRNVAALSRWLRAALLLAATGCALPALALSVQMEDLTWTELRDRITAGATTALVPIGGTEQNGPHMTLGKHNVRVKLLAARIAERLGNAVVAPVIAYVPDGVIEPPSQHMRYSGTISIPESAFESTLEAAARSLRRHGLRDIVFLGDHGGYRASLDRVAARLNREWGTAARVHSLPEYYRAAQEDFAAALKARGFSGDEIGLHAGLADTALMLALDPSQVRMEVAAARPRGALQDGVAGDPRRATSALGQIGVEGIVEATVAAVRARAQKAK
jgi:creatinine amidohydrolase/Fe(II)-dependent formamide hydrolase-like protein